LGAASEVRHYGTVVVIGGGVGTAIAYPTAKAMKQAGNHVIAIVGARTRELVILEPEIRAISDEVVITTDDGSYGFRGFVTQALETYLDRNGSMLPHPVIYTCGPEPMMKRVADITAARGIDCQIAVERAMACGMGTCQSCCIRVRKPDPAKPPLIGRDWCYRLACTDGPVFRGADLLW
jgi:ferredoxin--NADP+ reductase